MGIVATISRCFANGTVYYTRHAKAEMENEEFGPILDKEVDEAITSGEAIEEYPEDSPYPSALIFGMTARGRPLHTVCAYDKDENLAIVVTVYQPDPRRWIEHRQRRIT